MQTIRRKTLINLIVVLVCIQLLFLATLTVIPTGARASFASYASIASLSRSLLIKYVTSIILTRPLTINTLNPLNVIMESNAKKSFNYDYLYANDYITNNLGYGPIDVVYTWVNGSDPVWLESKRRAKGITSSSSSPSSSAAAVEGKATKNTNITNSTDPVSDSDPNMLADTAACKYVKYLRTPV